MSQESKWMELCEIFSMSALYFLFANIWHPLENETLLITKTVGQAISHIWVLDCSWCTWKHVVMGQEVRDSVLVGCIRPYPSIPFSNSTWDFKHLFYHRIQSHKHDNIEGAKHATMKYVIQNSYMKSRSIKMCNSGPDIRLINKVLRKTARGSQW